MKTENKKNKSSSKADDSRDTEIVPAVEAVSDANFPSELNNPQWAVISFAKSEATDLTYQEAVRKLQTLAKKDVSGLCIVTNLTAQKAKGKKTKNKKAK